MCQKKKLFRITVFYLKHVVFLGKIAKGTWRSHTGSGLMDAGDLDSAP